MYLADNRVGCDFNYWRFNVMGLIVNNINFFPTHGKSELCFLLAKLGEIDVCCVYLTQSIVLTNYHCVFYPLRTLYNTVVVLNKIIFQSKSVWIASTVLYLKIIILLLLMTKVGYSTKKSIERGVILMFKTSWTLSQSTHNTLAGW